MYPLRRNALTVTKVPRLAVFQCVKSRRRIVLPTFVVKLISAYLKTHDSKYLFPSQRGKVLRPKAFYAQWDQFADQFVPGLTFHGLRHSAKTWMIEDEVAEVLQYRQLGHTPKDVAGVYAHVTPKMEKRLRKAFDKRWQQAGGDVEAIIADGSDEPCRWFDSIGARYSRGSPLLNSSMIFRPGLRTSA